MFKDRLQVTLEITISGTTTKITAGNLKRFDLELTPWGYTGYAEWWIICVADPSEDTLHTSFVADDLATVELSLSRDFIEVGDLANEEPTPLVLKGIVLEKSMLERTYAALSGDPVMQRRYTIRFADRGAALWSQHRPCALYVNKTLKDLITANTPDGVTITHSWAASSTVYPVLSLGLGWAKNDASYYDFLHWLCDTQNVGFYYDPTADSYTIADAKPTSAAVNLEHKAVDVMECSIPPVRRDTVSVLNAYSEAATKSKAITNQYSVTGVVTDYVIRSQVAADLDTRVTLETARAQQSLPQGRAELARFPASPLLPGMILQLDAAWSTAIYQNATQFRILSTRISGRSEHQAPTADNLDTAAAYDIDLVLQLEVNTDPVVRHPPYRRPWWPFYVEGKVLSETGADDELTYQQYPDSQTSIIYYKVVIPLYDNQQVIVPYEPISMPGLFYFPLYKNERVLVALYFDNARVRAFLDWRPGAQLPLATQGDQLLMGKKDKNNTSMTHVYEDSKPVLTLVRTLDTDTQTLTISDGKVSLVVKDH